MLRLHSKGGFEKLQHLTPLDSHQGICTRVKTDLPKCTLKVSAVFYLLVSYLANNVCGAFGGGSFFPPCFCGVFWGGCLSFV